MSFYTAVRRLIGRSPATGEAEAAIFREMVEQSGDVICHLTRGLFTYVSPSAAAVFGWCPEAMTGTDGFDLIYPPDISVLKEVFARRAAGEVNIPPHQLRVICGDGSLKWSETTASSGHDARGAPHTILVIRDVSERKRLEEELAVLALKDGLTGLGNRRAFDEMLERAWRQTLRNGSEMALLLMDIDHFKQFNDTYGHQAGDDCLRAVAEVIERFARRPDDLACRYGGEEFALILGETDAAAAVERAEGIRSAVAALKVPHGATPGAAHVTVSIGAAVAVARLGGSIKMPESLLQAADHALYKAKGCGRNRVERSLLLAPPQQ